MARKKPAKKAKKKPAGKPAATLRRAQGGPERSRGTRKSAKKTMKKKAGKKAARKPAKASASAKASARRTSSAKKAAPKKQAVKKASPKRSASAKAPARPAAATKNSAAGKKPNLDRPRKTVADIHGIPSSLDMNRSPSAAKSGRAEMKDRIAKSTGAGPALTGGDVDADWESAESIGDEAPGGDNPTPDQDVVDDIGRALGVEYEDDEELQGGAEIADRDRHRWELDPSSKDDDGEIE